MKTPPSGERAKGEVRIEDPTPIKRSIARRAAESRATVPDLELQADVDMGACVEACSAHKWSITAALVRAFSTALQEVPRANGAYRDGRFELYSRINVGVVLATADAYLIPTIMDADSKPLETLTREVRELGRAARTGSLAPSTLSGATFTLANLGGGGISTGSIVISSSQAAAATAGAIRTVPTIRGEEVVPGRMMRLNLACDHRILYGVEAIRFLNAAKFALEQF